MDHQDAGIFQRNALTLLIQKPAVKDDNIALGKATPVEILKSGMKLPKRALEVSREAIPQQIQHFKEAFVDVKYYFSVAQASRRAYRRQLE